MLRFVLILFGAVLMAVPVSAQVSVIHDIDVFPIASQQVGHDVAGVGDLNGDGYDDFVAGDPGYLINTGRVVARSGLDGTVLWTSQGGGFGDRHGYAVATAGDIDGNGTPDVVIGSPLRDANGADSGYVEIVSGVDGSTLGTFVGFAGDQLGTTVAGGGDVNGDGVPDIVAGAPYFSIGPVNRGRANVYSGNSGGLLFSVSGFHAGQQVGDCVAMAGDINGDGRADVAFGTPRFESPNGVNSGRLTVYGLVEDVLTGQSVLTTHFEKHGLAAGDAYGFSVAAAGDVNGDGLGDLVVGAPGDNAIGIDSGSIEVLAGPNGAQIYFDQSFATHDAKRDAGARLHRCGRSDRG